jgi:hypothetical protein
MLVMLDAIISAESSQATVFGCKVKVSGGKGSKLTQDSCFSF